MFGASRLNTLSAAAAGASYPLVGTFNCTIGTNFEYIFSDYSFNKMSYVGPDSSSNPVFIQPFRRASNNYIYVGLIKINATTGAVSVGGITQVNSSSSDPYAHTTSEYVDANGFGGGTGNYAYVCYKEGASANYKLNAISVNQDAMTLTVGTQIDTGMAADANQGIVAYIGNSRVAAGGRYGGVKRFSRSGTTLTAEGSGVGYTHQIDNNMHGFVNNGTTQYRVAGSGAGGGANGVYWAASTFGTSNYTSSYSTVEAGVTVGSTGVTSGAVNNTDSFVSFATYNKVLTAHKVTWNSGTAPTVASGTSYQGASNGWPEFNQAYITDGYTSGIAVLVLQYGNNIKYREISVSNTTLTIGTEKTIYAPGSTGTYPNMNNYYRLSAATASVGTAKYICTINVQASGNAPIIVAARVA